MNRWVVLDGDLDVIESIENNVYPPRTPKNKDFEIAMLSPFNRIFLAKKNDELKAFLHNPPNFTNIIALVFVRIENAKVSAEICAVKENGNFAIAVDSLVEMLFSRDDSKHDIISGVVKKCKELRMN